MITRRRFLQTCAATGAAAAVAPTLWLRRARAQSEAFGQVKHLLVLFARGGMRSHCLFNAVGSEAHNPFGRQDAAAGTEWALGAVCGNEKINAGGTLGTLPGFHEITGDVAVIGTMDVNPGGPIPLDHDPAVQRLTTGDELGSRTLLGRILDGHPRYASGVSLTAFPPVDIGNTPFAITASMHSSLRVAGADVAVPSGTIAEGWETEVRREMNSEFAARVPSAFIGRPELLTVQKQSAFVFAEVLSNPILDVLGRPEAVSSGLSNQQLLDVLGNADLRDLGDFESNRSWGPDVAKALRFFELGAPVAVVERNMYDLHGREKSGLPVRAQDLVRQLAGLNALLKQMAHPDGGTYFDHTLVTVVSEFGRNNTEANGFNSARGSDHQGAIPGPVRNQAVPLMGGVVTQAGSGGRLFGATDDEILAQDEVHSLHSLHATLLDAVGVDASEHFSDGVIPGLLG